jgi:glycosyltransferase involved in cell wall biosynthesis
MGPNERAYDTRRFKARRVVVDADLPPQAVARTRASLDRQTLRAARIDVHIVRDIARDRAAVHPLTFPARSSPHAFGITVTAGTRLAPTALEKLAWAFLSFPDAQWVWAARAACRRCSTSEGLRSENTEQPVPLLAWRVGAHPRGPQGAGHAVHLTETLAWSDASGFGDAAEPHSGGRAIEAPRTDRISCLAQKPHSLCRPGDPVTFEAGPAASVTKARGERRLLMLVPWLAMGGADKFNLDVIRLLSARGWRVTVATTLPGEDAWHEPFSALTDDVFILPRMARLPEWPRIIQHLIETRRADAVLVTNSEFGYHLLPSLRQTAPGLMFADYCHMEQEDWKNGGYPRLAALYQPYLHRNLVSTAHLKRWLEQRGARSNKIRVLYTNVDTSAWAPSPAVRAEVRSSLGIADDIPLILFAGRLDPQKQPGVLADTLRRLGERGVPFHTVIAGDGPERAHLEARLESDGVATRASMLGAVPNDEVKRLMQAADMFFLPSAMEGLSLAIYEAMASGLCVVGAAVGGQRELVTDECGVLIDPGPLDDQGARYADAIEALARDRSRRMRLAAAARARVSKQFTLDRLGNQLDRALCANHPTRRTRASAAAIASGMATATAAVEMTRLESFLQSLWHELQEQRASGGAAARGR